MENKKIQSLRRRSEFLAVQNNGKKIKAVRWLTLCYLENSISKNRYGITISKKVGTAVTRNRLKRIWRGWIQKEANEDKKSTHFDFVSILHPVPGEFFKLIKTREVENAIQQSFKKFYESR